MVEQLTGTPNDEHVIKRDLESLRRTLEKLPRLPHEPEDPVKRMERATQLAEIAILFDMEKPEFLADLEGAARDCEREVFGTEETWAWAAREYRFDLPGQRFGVGLACFGYSGLLIDNNGELRLFSNGQEYSLSEETPGYMLEVFAPTSGRKRAADAVRRWNEVVLTTTVGDKGGQL